MSAKVIGREVETKRVTATVDLKTFERLNFWADAEGVSINQFLNEAIDLAIDFKNHRYPMTTIMEARVNQLVDAVERNTSELRALSRTAVSGFESLVGLTRGDNYLLENESGEIE